MKLMLKPAIINKGYIDIWQGKLGNIEKQNDYAALLTEEEARKADSITRPQLRSDYIEVRARLRLILADYLNQSPLSILIARTEHGKPFLPNHPQLFFNLSHSGNHVVLAVSTETVGIDIEVIRQRSGFAGLVNKCFAPQEILYWQALPEQDKRTSFYRFWTAKEAFVKAQGRGIALGLNKVELAAECPIRLIKIPEQYGNVKHWSLCELKLGNELCASVCVKNQQIPLQQIKSWPD